VSTVATRPAGALAALARTEIRGYARSPLFLLGAAGLAAMAVVDWMSTDDGSSSTMSAIAPAALLGVVGMFVMSILTVRSDRAAAVAGAVATDERTRTGALAIAIVVPATAALLWYAQAVALLFVRPPADWAVPYGPMDTTQVLFVMAALGVASAIGGPVLGLLAARWIPGRGVIAVGAVLVIAITIVLQGNFSSTWGWKAAWPWTYWYGPMGWRSEGDEVHWVVTPGTPIAWLGYLLALCALGVLVALYHDRTARGARLRGWIVGLLVLAAVLLALTLTLGPSAAVINPAVAPA